MALNDALRFLDRCGREARDTYEAERLSRATYRGPVEVTGEDAPYPYPVENGLTVEQVASEVNREDMPF